jgi:DNA-directed RNA polymerase specialized sigma24 family protein
MSRGMDGNLASMAENYVIYGLFDPTTGELRYVGKTHGSLPTRLNHHVYRAINQRTNEHKANWIRALVRRGLRPEIAELEALHSEEELSAAECWHIAYWRALGCRLTNTTEGGEGCVGYVHTDEAKRKMSVAKKGKPSPRTGTVQSSKTRLLVSRSKTGLTEEQQAAIVAMYREGFAARDVAARFGVSDKCVFTLLSLAGQQSRTQTEAKAVLTAEQIEEAFATYAKGYSASVLGKKYGVSSTTIIKTFKRSGKPTRSAVEQRWATYRLGKGGNADDTTI